MAQGSGGYGGPNFSAVASQLNTIAISFTSILSIQTQLKASLDTWRELERELALTRAAAGGAAASMMQMEIAARNFALATTYSAAQSANSFYNLASAGLTVKETMQAATGVLLLAQATLTDLGEASDITASTMAQFNLEASESYRISNLFVQSTNSSLATVNKLAFALRQVGPIAAQSNLSLETTVAMLDKLFDAGLRGEQAGTALRNAIARLASPVGQGKGLLEALNIKQIDPITGKLKDLKQIMEELSTKHLTSKDVIDIVGVEAAAGFTVLLESMKKNADGATSALDKHIQELTNTNSAYRQAVIQMNTLDGAMKLAANNFNDMRITIGQQLAPLVYSLASTVGNLADSMRNLSKEELLGYAHMALMVVQGGLLFKAMSSLQGVFTKGAFNLGLFKEAFIGFSFAAGRGAASMASFGARATAGLSAVTALTTGLAGMIGLVAGIAGIGIAMWEIYNAMKAIDTAKAKEAIDTTSKTAITSYADKKNLSPDATAYLADFADVSGQFEKQRKSLDRLFPVQADGAGSFARFRAEQEYIKGVQGELNKLALQYRELRKQIGGQILPAREGYVAELEKFYSTSTMFGVAALTGSDKNSFLGSVTTDILGDMGGGADQSKVLVTQIFDTLLASSKAMHNAASGADVQTAIGKEYEQVKSIIKKSNLVGENQKRELIDLAKKEAEAAMRGDEYSLMQFAAARDKAQIEVTKKMRDQKGYAGSSEASREFNNVFVDTLRSTIAPDADQARAQLMSIKAEHAKYNDMLNEATKNMEDGSKQIGSELVGFVTSASELNKDQINQFNAFLKTPKGQQDVQDAIREITKNGGSLRDAAQLLTDRVANEKFMTGTAMVKLAEGIAAIPIVDKQKMLDMIVDERIKTLDAMMQIVELGKGPTKEQILTFGKERASLEKGINDRKVIEDLMADLGSGGTIQKEMVDTFKAVSSTGMVKLQSQLYDIANAGKGQQDAAVEAAVETLKKGGFRDENKDQFAGLRITLRAYASRVQRQGLEAVVAAKQLDNRAAQSELKTDPDEQYVQQLLGLPTPEQMAHNSEVINNRAKFLLQDYFNMPLLGIDKEIQTAAIEYKGKLLDFQNRYRKQFQDVIAKGLEGTADNTDFQGAFSGKLLDQIMGSDADVDVFGQKFNKKIIQTTEGMQRFITTIETEFAKVAGGGDTGAARIKAGSEQLRGMVDEYVASYRERSADIDRMALVRNDVALKIREFMEKFNNENIIELFNQAKQDFTTNADGIVDINVDVALNARTAQINLDTQNAITQMRDKYTEAFKNLNIPVSVNATSGKFELVDPRNMLSANVSGTNGMGSFAGGGGGSFTGALGTGAAGAREKQIADYLKAQGMFSPAQLSGIMAVFKAENRDFNPSQANLKGSGAVGIGQWLGSRKDELAAFAGARGTSSNDLQTQLAFFIKELKTSESRAGGMLAAAQTPAEAVMAMLHFERTDGYSKARPQDSIYYHKAMQNASAYSNGGLVGTGQTPSLKTGVATKDTFAVMEGSQKAALIKMSDGFTGPIKDFYGNLNQGQKEYFLTLTESQQNMLVVLTNEFDAFQKRQVAIQEARIEFEATHAVQFATQAAVEAQQAIYDVGQGRLDKFDQEKAARASSRADFGVQAATAQLTPGDDGASRAALRQAIVAREILKLTQEHDKAVIDIRHETELQLAQMSTEGKSADEIRAFKESQLGIERGITDEYSKRTALAPNDIASAREAMQAERDKLEKDHSNTGMETGDLFAGFQAGAIDAVKNVQTMFELGAQASATAVRGLSDAVTNLMFGMVTDAKQAIAQMMMAIARLIIQMLVLKAIKSVIGFADGGVGGPSQEAGTNLPGIYGMGGVHGFAGGGVERAMASLHGFAGAMHMNKKDLYSGGVRGSKQSAVTIFGEGQWPEAFIPMVDRKSIPVYVNDNGEAHVPLPSGQTIPVTLKVSRQEQPERNAPPVGKFARGGVGGSANVIEWNAVRAKKADTAMAGNREAVSPGRRGGAGIAHVDQSSVTHLNMGGITIQGNVTPETMPMITEKLMEQVEKALNARDAEAARRRARGNGIMDQWGMQG